MVDPPKGAPIPVLAGFNFVDVTNALTTSGVDSIGHGGTCPHFYKWLGTGAP